MGTLVLADNFCARCVERIKDALTSRDRTICYKCRDPFKLRSFFSQEVSLEELECPTQEDENP
jgi:hypothetical protein